MYQLGIHRASVPYCAVVLVSGFHDIRVAVGFLSLVPAGGLRFSFCTGDVGPVVCASTLHAGV